MGRLSTFTEEIALTIAEKIANGIPLAVICREDDMPGYRTVLEWQRTREEFAAVIAYAREAGFDYIAYRARMTIRGKTEEDGGESTGDVQRDKAIVDADLKLLSKWDPKRYGDAVQLRHADADGGKVDLADTPAAAKLAALLEAVRGRVDGGSDAVKEDEPKS